VPLIHNDPEYWRKRSEMARALAEKRADPEGKAGMIEIAEKYSQRANPAPTSCRWYLLVVSSARQAGLFC